MADAREQEAADMGARAEDLDALFERASVGIRIGEPGIYEMSEAAYHADPCKAPSLSASVVKILLDESPAHARLAHPKLNPQRAEDDDEKFDRGKAMHSLFLEGIDRLLVCPERSPSTGKPVDKWNTNAAKAFRANARAAGLIPVLQHQETALRTALELLKRRIGQLEDLPAPFSAGKPEQTLVWREECGIWCRARIDWLHDDLSTIDDLKTVASASPGGDLGQFGRAVFSIGHDIQAAFYRRGLKAVTGAEATFRFVAVELDGPGISVCSLGQAAMAIADLKVSRAIGLWAHCLQTNSWPGYPRFRVELEPPAYELAKWETEREENLF